MKATVVRFESDAPSIANRPSITTATLDDEVAACLEAGYEYVKTETNAEGLRQVTLLFEVRNNVYIHAILTEINC